MKREARHKKLCNMNFATPKSKLRLTQIDSEIKSPFVSVD